MVALGILLVGALVAIAAWSWLAPRAGRQGAMGRGSARAGGSKRSGPLGLRSARTILEEREALEAEDLAQMLEAHNAWRRRRGHPERTVDDVELLLARERAEIRRGGGSA
ncbi:MAG TPA: hypothetical protein VKV21_04635 [Solirubrobacteraceae bacterium]|nr:hypothetical protein [Solirubrobacteraceae bacterium]